MGAAGARKAGGWGFLRAQDRRLWQELAPLTPPPEAPRRRGGTAVLAPPRAGVLALRAFGRFEVRQAGVLLDVWPRRKAKLLLGALALHPDGLRSAELAELIAGEEANPLNGLRVNTWALRRALEPAPGKGEDSAYVRRAGDRYRLAWELVEGFDLRDWEAALAKAVPQRETSPREAIATLEAGFAVVRGPLFDDGPPFDLFEADRERCRRLTCEALGWIAAQHRKAGDYGRAEAALGRAIALAPCDEAGYEALMRLQRARGDIAGVRRAYWDLRRALKTGLDLVPTTELEALYRQLAGGR